MKRRVVITGMGMITPLGKEVSEVWDGILAGRSGIHRLSIIDPTPFKVQVAGDIPDFDPGAFVDPKDHKRWIVLHCLPCMRVAKPFRTPASTFPRKIRTVRESSWARVSWLG